jgi:hypothetical protein
MAEAALSNLETSVERARVCGVTQPVSVIEGAVIREEINTKKRMR